MSAEEFFVCTKVENERCCFKAITRHDYTKEIKELTKEEAKQAAAAKEGAIEILKDALKKKDKVLMRMPSKVVTKGEVKYEFWMKRHAILTEDIVKKLLVEMKMVRFKKDIYMKNTFAYVNPHDETRTIYLCNSFWDAPKYLQKDSQPGTLIHEVSHFLRTDDIAYGDHVKPTLYIGCQGVMVKGNLRPTDNSSASLFEDKFQVALQKAFWNADNLEYEFELTINHSRNYVGGKYLCCGETARYSVCDRSVPDFFHTCSVGEKWEIEPLVRELCHRSEKIKGKLRIAEEMEKSLRKEKTSGNIAHSMNVIGAAGLGVAAAATAAAEAAAAGGSLFLAPSTFGISLLVGGCLGVVAAKVGISMRPIEKRAVAQKEELDTIFAECQCFFGNVKTFITWLKDVLSTGFQCYVLVKNIINDIIHIIEQVESQQNDWQKIMSMGRNIEQLCSNIEKLCTILLE